MSQVANIATRRKKVLHVSYKSSGSVLSAFIAFAFDTIQQRNLIL